MIAFNMSQLIHLSTHHLLFSNTNSAQLRASIVYVQTKDCLRESASFSQKFHWNRITYQKKVTSKWCNLASNSFPLLFVTSKFSLYIFLYFFLLQSRTDRIVFKLFGKDPTDFPYVLRAQVFLQLQLLEVSFMYNRIVVLTLIGSFSFCLVIADSWLAIPQSNWDWELH